MNYQNCTNLASLFFDRAAVAGERPFLWSKHGGEFRPQSWRQVAEEVREMSRGLRAAGVEAGDRVVLVSENRPNWVVADLAVMAAGGVTVPAYVTNTVDDHHYILEHSGAKAAIVSTAALVRRVLPAAARAPEIRFVVTMEVSDGTTDSGVAVETWEAVRDRGRQPGDDVAKTVSRLSRQDLACLIYTSGTGGRPKGVMLSHGAILCNVGGAESVLENLDLRDEVFLSLLPLSHAYEHTAGLYFPIAIGAEIYFSEGLDSVAANFLEVRPTIVNCVPRLYEVMRQRILVGARRAGGWRQRLFHAAIELGRRGIEAPGSLGLFERAADRVLDGVVRDKARTRFGGRLKAMVSGGAPLNYNVGLFFMALGVRVLQGYGQTETSPIVSCNRAGEVKLRSVGPPVAGAEVKIAGDGEILVRGEMLMAGYWRDGEATAAVLREGWLHTGDIGEVDEDGYLSITDRKKDIIVNSGGDNIAPQKVEGVLTVQPEIAQAMVYGDRRPHLVALLVPDEATVKSQGDEFQKVLKDAVARANQQLSAVERVKRFALAAEPFAIANNELTPTLKIRRHALVGRYRDRLEALYRGGDR